MAEAAGNEARRIRVVQGALVRCGDISKPNEGQARKAQIFEDIEKLLLAMEPVKDEVRKIIAPIAKAIATKEKFERDREAAPPETDHNSEID